ncbi:MAG: hypothetical protein EOO29_30795 [Comamonadaceae bacterium]|nr:MAG: hypothetical protein EOO29_30795 [Comamonadaceae bacterium]
MSVKLTDPCPCGRTAPPAGKGAKAAAALHYADCCGRYLDHWESAPAPDAESLMRSRYTAFVDERSDYLQATWHVSTRPRALDFEAGTRWLGLEVRSHRTTGFDRAEVEFVARYRMGGRAVRLHETSRFVREGGRWFYVDGDVRGGTS